MVEEKKFCKDCEYVKFPDYSEINPTRSTLYLCNQILSINYATGEEKLGTCEIQNWNGYCPAFKEREVK